MVAIATISPNIASPEAEGFPPSPEETLNPLMVSGRSPSLFTEDHLFRLKAPENSARVIFTLESVHPDVDVDLYICFDQNNALGIHE